MKKTVYLMLAVCLFIGCGKKIIERDERKVIPVEISFYRQYLDNVACCY
ncbi:MAG: hypothetical protein LBN19_04835 [Endomicrobium sp.]|nr:hypothetical protein [Endomicrobium sp.]